MVTYSELRFFDIIQLCGYRSFRLAGARRITRGIKKNTAMELETERLLLKLLTLSQLKLWVNNIPTLEVELNCKCNKGPIDGFFLNIINNQIKKIENDPENCIYLSFWLIIRKEDKRVLGSIDYKNIPNEIKEVEIGYGLEKQYEHNGYMAEAVGAFCKMAFMDEKIETIIAETEAENTASYKVLEKCGFKKYMEEGTHWWRLTKMEMNPSLNAAGSSAGIQL